MAKCPHCSTENAERDYYCQWCGKSMKEGREGKVKKLKERYNYLLDLSIVEDNSNDVDYFGPYNSKKKK